MKLNNKGFTIVEVLVTFVLVSIVSISLFSTISAFNEKRILESQRAKVYEYKNSILTRIQTDFIEKGLAHASITRSGSSNMAAGIKTTIHCLLKDGSERDLIIYQRYTKTNIRIDGIATRSDEFYIEYGTPGDIIREELPDLGETVGEYDTTLHAFVEKKKSTACQDAEGNAGPCVSKNLQINNVLAYITNENDLETTSHVLNVYIGFYAYDLGTKYAINLVAPIDYQKSTGSPESKFPVGGGQYQINTLTRS